jgi:hypothetical protein
MPAEAQALVFRRRHQPRGYPSLKFRSGRALLTTMNNGNKKGQDQISSYRKAKAQSSISDLLQRQT